MDRELPYVLICCLGLTAACDGESRKAKPSSGVVTNPSAKPEKRPVARLVNKPVRRVTVPSAAVRIAPAGMIRVAGGTFSMGTDVGGEPDERPAHRVAVASFFLDRTEVPNEAYGRCVVAGVCRSPSRRAWHRGRRVPVTGVSWHDAVKYCRWRGRRLPTEAEFERAVRGADGRRYPWGNAKPTSRLTVALGVGGPAPVGSRPAGRGPYGHDDLAGNVWEWVADPYDPFAYRRPTAGRGRPGTCPEILAALGQLRRQRKQGFTGSNPLPQVCEAVLRGGAYNYPAKGLRATNRVHHPKHWRIKVAGFRCALGVNPRTRSVNPRTEK
jgi:formylglycine-generating enzyme required for sulfatase activity